MVKRGYKPFKREGRGNIRKMEDMERYYARMTYNKIVYAKVCFSLEEAEAFIKRVSEGDTEGGKMML